MEIRINNGKLTIDNRLWADVSKSLTLHDDLTGFSGDPSAQQEVIIEEKITPVDGALLWEVKASLSPDAPSRSISMEKLIPVPVDIDFSALHCWNTSFQNGINLFDRVVADDFWVLGVTHHHKRLFTNFYGNDFVRWSNVRQAAFFDPQQDYGLHISAPGDFHSGIIFFRYDNAGLHLIDTDQYLSSDHPVIWKLYLLPVPGCYRPGMEWFLNKHREYFEPENKAVMELTGSFGLTNPLSTDGTLDYMQKFGAEFTELHNHFPKYGDWLTEDDEWECVVTHDYPELPPPPGKISRKKIHEFIQRAHDRNIKVLYYIQCSGDCFLPYAREKFADAIAINREGVYHPCWRECCMCNSSKDTTFGKHIAQIIEDLPATYPDIDGVFIDQLCYPVEDLAHSDGQTAINNKPAANLDSTYYANVERLAELMHRDNKIVWGNGSFDLQIQHHVDGLMAEGSTGASEFLKYFCLVKPLLVHQYPRSVHQVELVFSFALRAGAWLYSIGASSSIYDFSSIPPEVAEVFHRCAPMLETLRKRKYCFEPHPVNFPAGVAGDVFISENSKEYIVTAVTVDAPYENAVEQELTIELDLKDLSDNSKACYRTPFSDGWQNAVLSGKSLTLPAHHGMSIVRLTK